MKARHPPPPHPYSTPVRPVLSRLLVVLSRRWAPQIHGDGRLKSSQWLWETLSSHSGRMDRYLLVCQILVESNIAWTSACYHNVITFAGISALPPALCSKTPGTAHAAPPRSACVGFCVYSLIPKWGQIVALIPKFRLKTPHPPVHTVPQ